jgi:hypothetical protein
MEGHRPAPLQSCFNLNNHAPTQKRAAVAHQPEIARIARHQRATAAAACPCPARSRATQRSAAGMSL